LDHILELTYGAVLIGIAQEFGVGPFVLGLLANIAGFAFGAMALPSGFLADRFSERRLLMFYCIGTGIASIAVGLSPNIYILGVALTILGLALGIYHPVGSAYVARVVKKRGLGFGYLGIGGNLGVALAPILAGSIAALLGWRAPYIIFAIPTIFLAVLLRSFSQAETAVEPQPTVTTVHERTHIQSIIPPLVFVFCIQVLTGFIYRGVVTFLPLYLSQRLHFTFFGLGGMALAGSFTTVALIFGVAGQYLGGYLSERIRREGLVVMVAVMTTPLLVIMGNSEELALMFAASAFAFFYFMGQPIINSLIADYSPAAWRGRSFGIAFFSGFGLGSFSGSILGYIAERLGTNWVFTASAGVELVLLVFAVVLLVRALGTPKHGKVYPSDSLTG
jgi:MFS family permease